MKITVAIIGLVAVLAVIGYFFAAHHPEQAASHTAPDRHGSALFHGDNQAPAEAGSESDGVSGGQPAPGPAADRFEDPRPGR